MAITYTEQFETRKAAVELALPDGNYVINYTTTGPVGAAPETVNADVFLVADGKYTRVAYGSYVKNVTSMRFDASYVTTVSNQATISAQFYNDLQSIIG